MPLVSVILPTHNCGHIVGRAIRSVLAQTLTDLELIVVDDGSSDETAAVVGLFDDKRLIFIRHPHCRGAAVALITGVKASSAKWLAFQGSDDAWRIDKLGRQLSLLDGGVDAGLVCCGYLEMAHAGRSKYIGADARMQEGDWGADNICDFRFIASTWLLRRDIFDRAGGFDHTMPNFEDWELAFRLYSITSIRVVDEPLVIKYGASINPDKIARIASLNMIIGRHSPIWLSEPRVMARLYAELGHLKCLVGDTAEGRRCLHKALRLHTFSCKCWVKWGMSLFGPSGYLLLSKLAA